MTKRPKIGLALCSGGWRGMAHLGVLKALEEEGVKIDVICGCSSGSIIGGLYSFFGDVKKVENYFGSIDHKKYLISIFDPAIRQGLIKGNKFKNIFEDVFTGTCIENLPIKFCAVATDIISGKAVYIESGKIAEALLASSAVPGMFQPISTSEMKLVDGAISVVVPTKKTKQMGSDIIVGVNLYENIFPFAKLQNKKLSIYKILRISTFCTMRAIARFESDMANITVCPKINKYDFSIIKGFFKERDSAIEAGYIAMREKMIELKELIKLKSDQL